MMAQSRLRHLFPEGFPRPRLQPPRRLVRAPPRRRRISAMAFIATFTLCAKQNTDGGDRRSRCRNWRLDYLVLPKGLS